MEQTQIHPPHLIFYEESIRFNCESALTSVDFVASFIKMTNETKGDYEMTADLSRDVLNHVQNILTHSASISRYFWPPQKGEGKIHSKRAGELKEIYKVNNHSPLKNRKLRNQLEHFDENLDKYLSENSLVGIVFPSFVGGKEDTQGVPTHYFRAFFIETGIFEVFGEEFLVQPIIDELY